MRGRRSLPGRARRRCQACRRARRLNFASLAGRWRALYLSSLRDGVRSPPPPVTDRDRARHPLALRRRLPAGPGDRSVRRLHAHPRRDRRLARSRQRRAAGDRPEAARAAPGRRPDQRRRQSAAPAAGGRGTRLTASPPTCRAPASHQPAMTDPLRALLARQARAARRRRDGHEPVRRRPCDRRCARALEPRAPGAGARGPSGLHRGGLRPGPDQQLRRQSLPAQAARG